MGSEAKRLPRALQALLGTRIASRYRVEGLVGTGGMAVVFRGEHTALGRSVAIKVLRPELNENRELTARFDREARAASHLDHPNCGQVFDTGRTDSGLKFMVMPFLEGRELTAALIQTFSPSQAVALTLQILRGLEHAHRHGIIHRDIKPDNLFVTRDHNGIELIKVVDFGIAKIIADGASDGVVTRSGLIFGTPGYMSTEQAAGLEVDPRSDVFSAGVILYQMLMGALPYDEQEQHRAVRAGFMGASPPMHEHLPDSLRHVLSLLLAHDRSVRPPSATAAIESLQQVMFDLRRDPTPWVSLLELASRSPRTQEIPVEREDLREMDDALQRLLSQETLCSGEMLAPEIYSSTEPASNDDDMRVTERSASRF